MVIHYQYCPLCGKKLTSRHAGDDGEVPFCADCNQMWFDSFSSCVIVLTYNEYNEIAMSFQPHLTTAHWVYTSGFISPGETAEQAAVREVKEELGLDVQRLENGGTYWFKRGGMLMHAFFAFASKQDFVLSEEVSEAVWADINNAAELAGPVRPNVADYLMMKDFVTRHGICSPDELWLGQETGEAGIRCC